MRKYYNILPLILFIFSIVFMLLFLRIYAVKTAKQFITDFSLQNAQEIASGDTFLLSRKLNSLTTGDHWKCIKGYINKNIFFNYENGSCDGFSAMNVEVALNKNSLINLRMKVALPAEIFWISIVFILTQSFFSLVIYRIAKMLEMQRNENSILYFGIARQVAHDIRSPIMALNIIMQKLGKESPYYTLISSSSIRIQKIANDLLSYDPSKPAEIHIINPALLEKNIHELYKERAESESIFDKKIEFITDFKALSIHQLKIKLSEDDLLRMLSNLINNSADAISSIGKIKVLVSLHDKKLIINVIDDGHGVSNSLQTKLFKQTIFSDKKEGRGLGLYGVSEKLKSVDGNIYLAPNITKGTSVVIEIPVLS